jgi:hypothetical protein
MRMRAASADDDHWQRIVISANRGPGWESARLSSRHANRRK